MSEEIYHKQFARYYDYFQSGVSGDIEFYLEFFKDFPGKILEIGAGTGRITIPLAKAGHNVTALDISSDMLEILKKKSQQEGLKIESIAGDMRNFSYDDRFDSIILTFRSFQHMYAVQDQIKALRNIQSYLNPSGYLVFDVYNPSWQNISKGNWQWHRDKEIDVPEMGHIAVDYRNKYDTAKQMMYQEYRFTDTNNKQEIVPLEMRFFYRFEIEHLLKIAGYDIVNLYGDFKKNEYSSDSPEMVWVVKQSG